MTRDSEMDFHTSHQGTHTPASPKHRKRTMLYIVQMETMDHNKYYTLPGAREITFLKPTNVLRIKSKTLIYKVFRHETTYNDIHNAINSERIYNGKQCRTGFDFIDLDLTKLV